MKKSIFLLFTVGIIFGLFLVCNKDAVAQKKAKTVAKPIATPIVKDFDSSVNRLPPNFNGDNDRMAAICESLPRDQMKKGEFETEEEFKQRKANALSATKIYAFSYNDRPHAEAAKKLAERFPNSKALQPRIRYEIDEQAFMIELNTLKVSDYKSVSKGSYVGQNAFGAKTVVQKSDAWKYSTEIYVGLSIKLPVPVEIAKVLKDDLRVLVVVKPTVVQYSENFHKATFDFPSDIYLHEYTFVIGAPIDVWIYNYKTGEIMYKKPNSVYDVIRQHEDEIESEWRPALYFAEGYIAEGKIQEAKDKLRTIPMDTKAWKLVGDDLLKKTVKKELPQ